MDKRQIGRNAIASILQILVNGLILFVLYRFFLRTIGASQFGIWALVMAFTSFASVANLGFAGTVVKFVASSMANGDSKKTALIIQTSAISIAGISGAIMLAVFPIIRWGLKYFVSGDSISMAVLLLPYSFMALWLMMIAGIFLSALDGYKRTDIRGTIMIGISAVNLFLCFLLVPKYGLMGVAYAVIGSNFITLALSWIMIKKSNPLLPFLPYVWRKDIFKEVIGYATKFQVVSISVMFVEPLTKAFLSKFGGLSIVAFYEMASRLILQLRAFIVSAYQVLIPVFAEYHEKSPERIPEAYSKSYELIYYLALPAFALLIIWLPLISELWIGHVENTFVFMARLLAVSWFLNTLSVPAYMVSLGVGELKWNLAGHIMIAVLNVILGYTGGFFFGGYGVVAGAAIALLAGSIIISVPFQVCNEINISKYLPKASRALTCVVFAVTIIFLLPFVKDDATPRFFLKIFLPLIMSVIVTIMMLMHPLRQRLQGWIVIGLLGNR